MGSNRASTQPAVLRQIKKLWATGLRPFDHLAASMSWRGLRKFVTSSLANLPENAVVLNVGAGGRTARVIREAISGRSIRVVSLDIDPARDPDIVADVITFESPNHFDAIIMIEVLEHVRHPFSAIENVHRLLKPGGTLYMSTPFLFPVHDRPMDFFRYTNYGLEHLCSAFESAIVRARDSWAETLCVLLARMFKERSYGAQLFAPFAVTIAALCYPIAIGLSKLIRSDSFTTGYTVVARKSCA